MYTDIGDVTVLMSDHTKDIQEHLYRNNSRVGRIQAKW